MHFFVANSISSFLLTSLATATSTAAATATATFMAILNSTGVVFDGDDGQRFKWLWSFIMKYGVLMVV